MLDFLPESSEMPLIHKSFLDEWAQRFTGIIFKKIAEDGYLDYIFLFDSLAIKEFMINLKIEVQDIISEGDCLEISEAKAGLICETLLLIEKEIRSEDFWESSIITNGDMTFQTLIDRLKSSRPRKRLPGILYYEAELQMLFRLSSTPSIRTITSLFMQKVGNIIQ